MSDVKLKRIKKSYGQVAVLHGIDVDIADGEFTILVGPSGCGKSTLLRMIAGLEDISEGEIVIDGRVVNRLEPKDRDIAMVFQNYALYPQMTVAQNMGFALEMAGWKKPAIAAKVKEAAAVLGLEPLLARKPSQLSGGQRQRVAMGRAIVRDPKVFLFDEPLSNLDAKLRVQMRTEIKALHQRLKTTIVYVTHDQIEAMTMADKIVVMHGGRVEQMGRPLDLYDRPANLFVAGFLGSPAMNFLDGTLTAGEAGALTLPDGTVMPLGAVPAGLDGRRVVFGIRPENVALGGPLAVPARVVTVDPTGAETHLAVEFGGKPMMAVLRERVDVAPDDEIGLSFASPAVHFFDPDTQQALR